MRRKPFPWAALFAVSRVVGLPAGIWVLLLCAGGGLRGPQGPNLVQTISLLFLLVLLGLRLAERWLGQAASSPSDSAEAVPGGGEGVALRIAKEAVQSRSLEETPAPGEPRTRLFAALQFWLRLPASELVREIEPALLLLATGYALAEGTGGPRSPLAPLVFVILALLGGTLSRPAVLVVLGTATTVEAGSYLFAEPKPFPLHYLAVRLALLWICGSFYRFLVWVEASRRRYLVKRRMKARLEAIHRDLRLFRLETDRPEEPVHGPPLNEEERECLSAMGSVYHSLEHLLEMSSLAFSPPPHSLLLFFLGEEEYLLKKGISASRSLVMGAIPRGRGVLGMVEKRGEPVFLKEIPDERRLLPYYRFHENISRLAALPVLTEGELLGILVADRREKIDFSETETRSLSVLSREVLRVMEFERLLLDLHKQKKAYEKFHQVAHEFNHTRRSGEVAAAAISAAQDICGAEFAALTVHDPDKKEDFILAARWSDHAVDHLCGRRLMPGPGLVSKAVKVGRAVPEKTAFRPHQVLFDASIPIAELAGAKVFPLLSGKRVLGTLVVGDTSSQFLSVHSEHMLEVLVDHAALALAQADLFEQLELMATTDGLTGLANHRSFQTRLEEAFQRARRYGRHLSLLILDIDHFKVVNDLHGHLTGDQVLRVMGEMLTQLSRQTDVVARCGGEEFAIIMEETDSRGAQLAAERVRETIAGREFGTPEGAIWCTLSIGLASYPENAADKDDLVALADQALYAAKHAGRNRVVACALRPAAALGQNGLAVLPSPPRDVGNA